MSEGKVFFYMKDVEALIIEAKKAGGTDLGIVISPATEKKKPELRVNYLCKKEGESPGDDEGFTNAVGGCPFPPRCE